MAPTSEWVTGDWINAGLLFVGLATLVATVWAARTSLRRQASLAEAALQEQAELAREALEHQTAEAQRDRVWERRATLYLDFLTWLDVTDAEVANVSLREFQKQMTEDSEHDRQMFAAIERQTPIPPAPAGRMSSFVSLMNHLDPPRQLALRLELFGSDRLRRDFERYKKDILLQEFMADDGIDAMVKHQEDASGRLRGLRRIIVDEIDARQVDV